MKKNLFFTLIGLTMLSIILVGCGNKNEENIEEADSDEVIELKLGHVSSEENHYQAFAVKFKELVSDKSNGKIEVNIFPQAQLGGADELLQGARSGSVDMFIEGSSSLTGTIEELKIFDLPYLFDSIDQGNDILSGKFGQKTLEILQDYDLKGLGYGSVMQRNVFSIDPIESLSDMKGFKIRLAEAPAYIKAYESLNAQPTPIAFDELYLSLNQGVVDGGEGSPDNYIQEKFYEVADNYNLTKMHYLPSIVIMSGKTWSKFSPDQQTIIQEATNEALPESLRGYDEAYEQSLEEAVENGVKINEIDTEEFKKAVEPIYDELLDGIPNGHELFEELQKEIR